MKKCGMKKGSSIFIQSSWGEFYKYTGTPVEFIETILETIGSKGTLSMAAFPKNKREPFDVKNTPSNAGYLSEVFRKYPGVKRSLNSHHSVCAIGDKSDYLLNEHHISETCWDERSPFYKMAQINTLIFMFGLDLDYRRPAIWHCPESLLKDEIPYYKQFWKEQITCQYTDFEGKVFYHKYLAIPDDFNRRFDKSANFIKKYFDKSKYKYLRLSNLSIKCFETKYTLNRILELARQGIINYEIPDPADFFDSAHKK